MAVRATERRLPAGFTAADLGQSYVSADGKLALVSYLTTSLTVDSLNHYAVFVVDEAMADQVVEYEWMVMEDAGDGRRIAREDTTNEGLFCYRPEKMARVVVSVKLLDELGRCGRALGRSRLGRRGGRGRRERFGHAGDYFTLSTTRWPIPSETGHSTVVFGAGVDGRPFVGDGGQCGTGADRDQDQRGGDGEEDTATVLEHRASLERLRPAAWWTPTRSAPPPQPAPWPGRAYGEMVPPETVFESGRPIGKCLEELMRHSVRLVLQRVLGPTGPLRESLTS